MLFPRSSAGRALNHLLVDGMMRAGWWIEREPRARATLVVCPRERLSRTARAEIAAEAEELLGFVAVDATSHGLRFEP